MSSLWRSNTADDNQLCNLALQDTMPANGTYEAYPLWGYNLMVIRVGPTVSVASWFELNLGHLKEWLKEFLPTVALRAVPSSLGLSLPGISGFRFL